MVRMLAGKVVVEVSESKAEKLAGVLGYKYLPDEDDVVTDDLSPSFEDDDPEDQPRPVSATARKPGRPRKVSP